MLEHLGERRRDLRERAPGRLPGAAGQHEHRVGFDLGFVPGLDPGDREFELAAVGLHRVFRHRKRAALRLDAGWSELRGQRAGFEGDAAELHRLGRRCVVGCRRGRCFIGRRGLRLPLAVFAIADVAEDEQDRDARPDDA